MMPTATSKPASPQLQALDRHYQQLKTNFHGKHKKASQWLQGRSLEVNQLRTTSQQLLAAASLAGGIAMNQPVDKVIANHIKALESAQHEAKEIATVTAEERSAILEKMKQYVQRPPGHLDKEEELYLEQQLSDMLGFDVAAELDGHRLNHSIGVMGGEQHLRRFPNDTLSQHDAYQEAGIAPNRGAFGWFTDNGVLTPEAVVREKYYFAVQTLYLPDWNTNHAELKPWYKFRKMIAINPANQIAVVGVVGDAGPALWVNKQYGGSPEIIREGKIWSKEARGKVILLFVDDADNTVPLGPIDLTTLQQELNTET